jgi:hypothetical protein
MLNGGRNLPSQGPLWERLHRIHYARIEPGFGTIFYVLIPIYSNGPPLFSC